MQTKKWTAIVCFELFLKISWPLILQGKTQGFPIKKYPKITLDSKIEIKIKGSKGTLGQIYVTGRQ